MQFPHTETFFASFFVPPALSEVCFSIISFPVDSSMKTNLTLTNLSLQGRAKKLNYLFANTASFLKKAFSITCDFHVTLCIVSF